MQDESLHLCSLGSDVDLCCRVMSGVLGSHDRACARHMYRQQHCDNSSGTVTLAVRLSVSHFFVELPLSWYIRVALGACEASSRPVGSDGTPEYQQSDCKLTAKLVIGT